MERKDKQNYYLDIAEAVVTRGTCLRRNFGAIIVKQVSYSIMTPSLEMKDMRGMSAIVGMNLVGIIRYVGITGRKIFGQ